MPTIRKKLAPGSSSPRGDAEAEPAKRQQFKVTVDVVNEAIVVAALIALWSNRERRKELLSQVRADHIATALYAAMWRALEEMHRRGLDYDPRTLVDIGGGAFALDDVSELIEVHPEPPGALDHHVVRLKWSAAKVRAVKGPLTALLEAMESPAMPPERVKLLAMELAQTLDGSSRGALRDDREVAERTARRVQERHDGIALYPFGLEGFDAYEDGEPRVVPGVIPGGMTLLAGLSSSGKSAVAKRLALAQANFGKRVLYCSWEMGFERDLEAMACMNLGLDVALVKLGRLERHDLERVKSEIHRLSKVIRFSDKPFDGSRQRWSNDEALDVLGNAIAEAAADVVVVDLWKMLLRYTKPEDEELALTMQLRQLQDLKCHGILLHQINAKDVERRSDFRPTRDSLKGAGVYLERPDNIFGVHRPGMFGKVPDKVMQILFLKQRDWLQSIAVEFEWDGREQLVRGGRTIDYTPPGGESEIDKGARSLLDKKFRAREERKLEGKGKRPA